VIHKKIRLMLGASLFCLFLNAGQTLEAAESQEVLKKKMATILRQIPDVYELTDGASLNGGNFENAFQLLGADLRERVQRYQDEALARRLSSGDKGKEEDKGNVSGTTERMIMPNALGLPELFLLDALRGIKPTRKLLNQEDALNAFYLGMSSGNAFNSVFTTVFNSPLHRFYMKSSFWNIDFVKNYKDFALKLAERFNIKWDVRVVLGMNDVNYHAAESQYWNANNWGSGEKIGERFSYYSQPEGFAQRHIISETKVQPVTHQGSGDMATNNCGLHALINAELFFKKAQDKDFLQNHDQQINQMRAQVADSYKNPNWGFKETDIERALSGNLDRDDLFNVANKDVQDNSILISIPEQIKQIAQDATESLEKSWKEHFEKKMSAFCRGGVGQKIIFVFNASEYMVEEELRERLDKVTKDTENDVERDLFNVFNQHDKAAHWITVMFEKTGKINTTDGVNRYLIKTTLADSLAGSHYKDATFLQLFFLQQLKKYEDEQDKASKK
jgi:hypothetical protein